jgi:hypothetical protein
MFHSQMHGRFLLALRKRDLTTALALDIVSPPPLGVDGPAAKEGSGGGRVFSLR